MVTSASFSYFSVYFFPKQLGIFNFVVSHYAPSCDDELFVLQMIFESAEDLMRWDEQATSTNYELCCGLPQHCMSGSIIKVKAQGIWCILTMLSIIYRTISVNYEVLIILICMLFFQGSFFHFTCGPRVWNYCITKPMKCTQWYL